MAIQCFEFYNKCFNVKFQIISFGWICRFNKAKLIMANTAAYNNKLTQKFYLNQYQSNEYELSLNYFLTTHNYMKL